MGPHMRSWRPWTLLLLIGGTSGGVQSFWNPSVVLLGNGTIVLTAQANLATSPTAPRTFDTVGTVRSHDGGATWDAWQQLGPPGAPQAVYTASADKMILFGKSANLITNGSAPSLANSCYQSESPDGRSWSPALPMNVTGANQGPHFGGGSRTHGIELRAGPYKGRLVLPRLGSPAERGRTTAIYSYALYSDDNGASWTTGQTTEAFTGPDGGPVANRWDECTLTELRNGSVLLSGRIDDANNTDPRHPDSNNTRVRTSRGFARSDDGGASWAEHWVLFERQPEIPDVPCSDALVFSFKTGAAYFGHPEGDNRGKYTLRRSMDSGATWEDPPLAVVYPGNAGYSDMHVLPDDGFEGDVLGVAFQRQFVPPDPSMEGGGYDLGWATVHVPAQAGKEVKVVVTNAAKATPHRS